MAYALAIGAGLTPSGLGVLATQTDTTSLLAVQGGHGDLEESINSSGVPQGSFAYDPFGNALSGGSGSSVLGYQGEWTDSATTKVSMAARWYDAGSGRFLSRDTVQPPIQGGLDTNPYAYGGANPLVNVDPTGHQDVLDSDGGGVGGIGGIYFPPIDWGAAAGALARWGLGIIGAGATALGLGRDSSVQSSASTASALRVVDRWWEHLTFRTDTPSTRSGTDTPTPREGGGQSGSGAAGAAGRALTYLPPPAAVMNLGGGRLFLPTGATVPTGLTSLPGATSWVPQDTGCQSCTELKANGSGATSVPFGAFAQSATGDPCGMGLSMLAPRPRVCLNNGKSMVDQTKDLACTSLQATLSDPNLAGVVVPSA